MRGTCDSILAASPAQCFLLNRPKPCCQHCNATLSWARTGEPALPQRSLSRGAVLLSPLARAAPLHLRPAQPPAARPPPRARPSLVQWQPQLTPSPPPPAYLRQRLPPRTTSRPLCYSSLLPTLPQFTVAVAGTVSSTTSFTLLSRPPTPPPPLRPSPRSRAAPRASPWAPPPEVSYPPRASPLLSPTLLLLRAALAVRQVQRLGLHSHLS